MIVRVERRTKSAGKRVGAAEISGRDAQDVGVPDSHACLEKMITVRPRGEVLQLHAALRVRRCAHLCAAPEKRVIDVQRNRVERGLLIEAVANVLKACFVDSFLIEQRGFGYLHDEVCALAAEGARWQRKPADALQVLTALTVVEPSDQRVLLVHLEIKPCVSVAVRVGRDERVVDDHRLQGHRIERGCIHYRISIADVSPEVSRERRAFRNNRTA